ncbi:caspase family protein [Chondrinema litorale]|uniref:caspase family protein n=1 Tax=Chondrinema litorale TaxID=2994555 RepID=UPI002542E510|nr:caspase family protein [Chondrinema litorale]UZS00224.1 caspase family protein [Chondrinema litorale]
MEAFAVIIGIAHYQEEKKLHQLDGAINDAQAFYDWAINPKGGKVTTENAILLLSQNNFTQVITDQIEDALINMIQKALAKKQEDPSLRFYFFFSGHGLGLSINDVAMLVTNWRQYAPGRGISSFQYNEDIINRGIFSEAFFFIDCCRSRYVGVRPMTSRLRDLGAYEGANNTLSLVAMATSHHTSAYQEVGDSASKMSYFTRALLSILNGEDFTQTEDITVSQLQGLLEKKTSELAKEDDRTQDVRFYGQFLDIDRVVFQIDGKVLPSTSTNVIFEFSNETEGPYVLENGILEEINQWDKDGGNWELSLPRGLYTILDSATSKEKSIKVRNENTLQHVKF